MFEYDIGAFLAADKLDEYDFTDTLRYCSDNRFNDSWEIRDEIIEEHKELEEYLDNLSNDEFMEYLEERYNVKFEVVVTYRMRGI